MPKLNAFDDLKFRYDWKTLIRTFTLIVLIAIALFIALNKSYFAMLFIARNMNGETTGIIYSRHVDERILQTAKTGNRIQKKLWVKYKYKVNGKTYSTGQLIDYSPLIANSLNHLQTYKLPVVVVIKYIEEHPEKSVIWMK